MSTGDQHGSKTHPERVARGRRSGPRKYPERYPRGEHCKQAELTNEQVIEIRERYVHGSVPQATLAEEYGVSVPAISEIVNGKKWQSIGGPILRQRKRINN